MVNSNRFARELMHVVQRRSLDSEKLLEWTKRFHWKPNGNYDSKFAGLALSIQYLPYESRVKCFEDCLQHRGKYTDRALAYTLKYLPHDFALKYYKLLHSDAKDNVLKEILHNEIPLLSVKDKYFDSVKDDLIVLDSVPKEYIDKYIDPEKLQKYLQIDNPRIIS